MQNLYERAKRKQTARLEEQAATEKADHLRVWGELLQANLYAIHRGEKQVTVENYYDGSTVTIPLDVRLSPSANAQKYFKEYKKKQTAAKMLKKLLADGQREIDYLASVQYEVSQATGEAALAEIRAELKAGGYLKNDHRKEKRSKPADFLRYTSSDGFEILVGRNNAQNDKLTLHTARGQGPLVPCQGRAGQPHGGALPRTADPAGHPERGGDAGGLPLQSGGVGPRCQSTTPR